MDWALEEDGARVLVRVAKGLERGGAGELIEGIVWLIETDGEGFEFFCPVCNRLVSLLNFSFLLCRFFCHRLFLFSRGGITRRRRVEETISKDMTQFMAVGASRWHPWVTDLHFHHFSTLSLKFHNRREGLCKIYFYLDMR